MKFGRLSFEEEQVLWDIAQAHFGLTGLQEVLLETWSSAKPPDRYLVEYLDVGTVGQGVLGILKDVQIAVHATVPGRESEANRIALFSRHAQHLTSELISRLPPHKLPRSFRGVKLEDALGV